MSLKNYGLLASFLLALSSPASALVVITSDTSGAGSTTAPFEQSVTTPAGGSWTDSGFGFVDTGSNSIAEGSLYALTQADTAVATLSNVDLYVGGNAFTLNGATYGPFSTVATQFDVTGPAPVAPEPGTLGLMAGAMAAAALILSRRRG